MASKKLPAKVLKKAERPKSHGCRLCKRRVFAMIPSPQLASPLLLGHRHQQNSSYRNQTTSSSLSLPKALIPIESDCLWHWVKDSLEAASFRYLMEHIWKGRNNHIFEISSSGGVSNIKISNFYSDFTRTKSGSLQPLYGIRTCIRQKQVRFVGLVLPQRSTKPFNVRCGPSSEIECMLFVPETAATNSEDGVKETKSTGLTSQMIPNSLEVHSLLTEICDTTSIAEFELKLGGFRLYVTRDLAGKSIPPPSPSSPPSNTNAIAEAPFLNGSVSTPSLAISKPVPSLGGIQTLLDKATDEGLVILQSPRVGYFRRSRTIKGKRAPPSCKEKQTVKEGQVLCYIEQLGGEIPIESDVSGEVIKILREDGEPVGYGDTLLAILPSFPGIKKLQ
ncbi:hypothetical protein HHK36_006080 [Tetracentron sinense]|uniref:Lipoyl-binding domain-containing protein n=1 Tax=Tetracentron sinense TaxID=13715 RepID=A0A834ZGQ7_TETSI|nr:hypothetical protein HHK36_006080 [Tetracentron sinense]